MKDWIKNRSQEIKDLNGLERSMLIALASLFLPYQFSAIVLVAVLAFGAYQRALIPAIKEQNGALFLYAFIVLESIVSAFYHNGIGLVNTLGFLLLGLFIALYRKVLNPKLFSLLILEALLFSWIAAGYGLYEYYKICLRTDHAFFDFVVLSRPKNRVNSTFMNANFYATMIEFFLCFCLYQWTLHKTSLNRIFCLCTALINVFMLRLTGCRTAFLPLVVVLPLFFWIAKEKRGLKIAIFLEAAGVALFMLFPALLPRSGQFSTFASRIKIWKASIQGILEHPLFGQGPQTYTLVAKRLHAHKAPHAHNIYLDSILSYGIVGTLMMLGYFWNLIKETWATYRQGRGERVVALIACFYAIALIHGVLDVTMNFLPTGCVFFMILNSAAQFKIEKNN